MIILFDVDGVLVHSRAYHIGLQNTVEFFARRMGLLEPHTLTQPEIDLFEANSVTVEWESSAIAVAALLLERLKLEAAPAALPTDFWQLCAALATQPLHIPRLDFSALAQWAGTHTPPGVRPSLAVLNAMLPAGAKHSPEDSSLFKIMWANASPLPQQIIAPLEMLLGHCYDISISPTMQVFQNYVVGHEIYQTSYATQPHFASPALLETEDHPHLAPEMRLRLLAQREAERAWFTLYTARPSLPPREVMNGAVHTGFTPEAEMALHLNGFENGTVPIMAVGRLEWAARRVGQKSGDWVKPSPLQSLAAIATARTGRELEAMEAAHSVATGGRLPEIYAACAGEAVHVFEDSASSLRAVTRAVEMLNAHGLNLTLTRHGIAPVGSPKQTVLATIADYIHSNVNQGLAQIL